MGSASKSTIQKPLTEHIQELRVRFTWVAVYISLGCFAGYMLQAHLLKLLQKPLGQTLYYTSPTGGFAFVFKLVVVAGIIFALPAILYNIFRFIEPVLEDHQRKGLTKYTVWSFILAYAGIVFAYYISLPSALHFLTGFGNGTIKSLINAGDYFNFALSYVAGFALLFQLPLIVLFINRIKPLKPGRMMGMQRYIILGSFILAAILTPTPDPFNQTMMAAPMILLYQVSIFLVILTNKGRRKNTVTAFKPEIATATPPVVQDRPAVAATMSPAVTKPLPASPRYISEVKPARPAANPVASRAGVERPARPIVRRPIIDLSRRNLLVGNDFF
ncbi:MAG: Sec-independent protein translocase subunit TatC, sec-independent protein translocase protein TatC [Candidatus Saccharibacteria bacterium]|nr:Sec-independent protein translocase subunit TatC, sec-independent protein translocase protein TatC [Candidatus Saccharibacteria bacterium]